MAGARACASVTVPKRLSSASHPDSAPGTVTSSTLCCGIVACPFASSASRVMRLPARPLALSPYSLRSLADHTMANIDRKSTRLNSSHGYISYAVFCLKKKKKNEKHYKLEAKILIIDKRLSC